MSGVLRTVLTLWIALVPLSCALPASGEAAPSLHGKRALILHSYYKGFQWTDDENRGIESVLLPDLGASNLYVEYMDTKRFYQKNYTDQFPEIYREKFRFHKFDVILATDNNAFDFLRHYRDTLFPGVPVVFCGVNYFNPDDLKGLTRFTGVSEEADVKDTLALALKLHPQTRHIFVVNEQTETGKTIHDEIVHLEPSLAGQLDFTLLEDKSMEEIQSTLRNMPPDSIVFYSFFSRDKTGRLFDYEESAAAVSSASSAPIYGAWDFNLGLGIVGGKLISGFYQGETAGRLAKRVLEGESADGIPVIRFSPDRPNRYMFDYRQVKRFGIEPAQLPAGSIFVNKPASLFTRYRNISLIGAGAFVFLAVVNSILFLNISRRKQAEEALREHWDHLEDLVRQRSAELQALNAQLQLDILERERTEKALRQAEASYRGLFENAAEGIYQASSDGRLTAVNPAFAQMAGYPSPEVMIAELRDFRSDFFVQAPRREEFEDALRSQGEVHGFEAAVYHRSGKIIWILENARAVREYGGIEVYYEGIVQDITQRKQALEALRESQELLNKTFASLRDALIIVRADNRQILDCNPATIELFGFDREEVIGQSVLLLHVDQNAFEQFGNLLHHAVAENGYLDLPMFRMRRKDGETFPTQHSAMPLYAEDGTMLSWVSVIRDITEQNRTEEKLELYRQKLRALAAELTVVEAKERRAIAAELHENIGQILATSRLKIASLRTRALEPQIQPLISEIDKLIEETLQHTRSLTYQLSPPILYQLGLEAALKWLGENMEKQYGFVVVFSRQGESGDLDEESRVFLFSAVRELLVNVAKHAGADQVDLRLRWSDDHIDILVRDNGNGFRRNAVNGVSDLGLGIAGSHDGFGLFNIQERVSDLGGRVWMRSEPSRGTAVKIQLPLRNVAVRLGAVDEHQNIAG